MSRIKKTVVGICPHCGEYAKLTTTGVCMSCYKRQDNSKRRGVEYIKYIDLPQEKRPKRKEVRDEMLSLFKHREKETQVEIPDKEEKTPKERNQEWARMEILQRFQDLEDKRVLEIEFKRIDNSYKIEECVQAVGDLLGTSAMTRTNRVIQLMNEIERYYKHRLEASYDTEAELERYKDFKEIDKVRRKIKQNCGLVIALNSALTDTTLRDAIGKGLDIASQVATNYIARYESGKIEYQQDPTSLLADSIKDSIYRMYRVSITLDPKSNKVFTQDRSATSPEAAIRTVKQFISSHSKLSHFIIDDTQIDVQPL